MIKAKYGSKHFDLMAADYKRISTRSPWKYNLHQKDLVYRNTQCVIGNGSSTAFWLDTWFAGHIFKQTFHKLYLLTDSKNASIEEVWNASNCSWSLNFRRHLKDDEIVEWAAIAHILPNLNLTDRKDNWTWKLDHASFSTKSSYSSLISSSDLSSTDLYRKLWSCPYLIRVKFLLWEITISCLNIMDRLQKRCPWIKLSPSWCCLCKQTMKLSSMFSLIALF